MKTINTIAPALFALTAVSACGGGSTSSNNFNDTLPFSADSTAETNVTAFLTTPSAGGVTRTIGSYNRESDTFDVGSLSGSYDQYSDEVTLSNGGDGFVSLGGDFSGVIGLQSADGTEFGVFGIAASSIPETGTASYTGGSNVIINDGTAVYELEGTSQVDVDFAASRLKSSLDNLDGTRSDAAGVSDVTDVAQVDLTFVTIASDGSFEGGFLDLFSDTLGTFESEQEVLEHQGALFGPEAVEVGGVFTVDDTQVGSLLIHGVYTAD